MSNFGSPVSPRTSRSPGSPGSPSSPDSPGHPRSRRRSVSPGFLRLYADRGSKSPPQAKRQKDSPKSPVSPPESLVRLIEEGNINGFEELASRLSASERTLAFISKRRYGSGKNRSLVSVAINRGELPLLQVVLRWIPRGQAATVLMSADDNERTPLMLAAATGNTAIFDAIASNLPPAEILQHLNAQCAMGNSIFSYAVLSGSAEMIEAVVDRFPLNQVLPLLCVKNYIGETALMQAARVPGPDAFRSIAKLLTIDQVKMQLESMTNEGHTALSIATRNGAFPTWKEVASKMAATEVNRQLLATDVYGEDAIMLSIRSGNDIMFFTVIRHLKEEQLLTQLGARNAEGQTPVQVAVICNAKTILAAMVRPSWVAACKLDATDESEMHQTALDLAAKPPAKLDIICCLLASGATPSARTVLRLVRNCGYGDTQGDEKEPGGFAAVRECFLGAMTASEWAPNPLIPGLNLSVALIEAIRQSSDSLARLRELRTDVDTLLLSVLKYLPDTVAGFDRFHPATTTGENRQTKPPPPSTKRALTGLGEVQASLSSTVARGQKKNECVNVSVTTVGTGLTLVQELLEPELAGLRAKKCPGPLAQAVQFRHQEFICSPLVVDYLRVKFSAGLPNPFRETNWRRESGRMDRDLARFMLDEDESTLKVYILQGGCSDSPRQRLLLALLAVVSWTYLPGLQFILAGLVGNTAAFFAVPAMRLALDVMVYMGIMALFVVKVVVIKDAGVLTPWEFLWLIYVVGAVWQQKREVEEIGSIRTHFSNPWKIVDTASLVSLITAQVFRLWAFVCHGRGEHFCGKVTDDPLETDELNEIYLAQYFQAVSAPFVLGKVLFLTQIHSTLGPLMHSTFRMFSDLARFGALMLVFILGFALAFYALFGSTSALLPNGGEISDYDTYFSSLLTLFGSMLGTFDFSVFSGAPMEVAGIILLVLFLCLMNVTLLNLLIAILSTTHAKVEKNADEEAVLSEALIITQYRQAMRSDSLPSPLNIPQEFVSHLFWWNTERAKEIFARGMFWLITGPVAIAATAVLWAMSLPLTLVWMVRVIRSYGPSMIVPSILGISFNLGIAPVITALLWLLGVAGIWRQGDGVTETSDLNEIEVSRAHRRRSALGGAGPPLANIALAALAEKTKGSRAIAVTDTNVNATQGGNDSANPKDKSRLWKQAAELHMIPNTTDGGANRTVGERPQGFHVAAALHASHGLTIQKLRKALDDQSTVTNQAEKFQREEVWSDALASISEGQERLEENIREADKRRERMEAKLDDLIHAFLERDRRDSEKKSANEEKSPISGTADSIPSSNSARREEPVRRTSVVRDSVADRSAAQEGCAKDSDHKDIN